MAENISIDSWSATDGHMGTQQDTFDDGTWETVEAQENPQSCGSLVPMTAARRWRFTNLDTNATKDGAPPIGDPAP